MAIPLLSGSGTVLLLTNQPNADLARMTTLGAIIALVFMIAWCVLYAADRIMTRLGEGKVCIMTRVLETSTPPSPCNSF